MSLSLLRRPDVTRTKRFSLTRDSYDGTITSVRFIDSFNWSSNVLSKILTLKTSRVLLRGYKLKSKQNFKFYTSDELCTRYIAEYNIICNLLTRYGCFHGEKPISRSNHRCVKIMIFFFATEIKRLHFFIYIYTTSVSLCLKF